MDHENYWAAVSAMRTSIADMLDTLGPDEWDVESVCPGWRVRDVAGHLSLVPIITTWQMVAAAPRARFNPNRINTVFARRYGSRDPREIVKTLRAGADDRHTAKALDVRNSLFDAIVHSQDIAIPLGRTFPVAPDYVAMGLQRVWEMGWPFHARRKFGGFTLRATDADWAAGTGPEVAGPALALLLLTTGRRALATPSLTGPVDRPGPSPLSGG